MPNDQGVPNCTAERCIEPDVIAYCKDATVPTQYLVYEGKDSWCYCDCKSALATLTSEGISTDAVKKCSSAECTTNPAMPLLCQGYDRGQTVLIQSKSGKFCNCACWGGAPAPYRIANGDGEQRSLHNIPVGSFVAACGLDLGWINVPLRYAALPVQAYPQPAVRIKIGEAQMVVPTSHLFLTAHRKLIPAKRMLDSIALMGADGSPVSIDEVKPFETDRAFQFAATWDAEPPENLDYHLFNSEGVISADYAVQKSYQEKSLPEELIVFGYD